MNRLVSRISVLSLCALLAASPALASKKKKKAYDLSANPLASVNSKQPDKELFDKAMKALKKGRFDVARLDLQTLLNTYPDTEYAMRAKLAIGDTWYREGGSAALQQAESEYKDFITFFPNSPEAAEAQMKVGDIYYQQMEKPDRDPQNAVHAEQEYRTMIEQFPDSTLVPRAQQRLREVQEVLAQRQFEIGEYYATRENWAASIARLQTVSDSYPLFSHSDEALITIGDAYATEAQAASRLNLDPKAKTELVKYYNNRAADSWSRVVTRYPMAPHVEDAKDRLIAMGRNVPDPTPAQLAESEAEEGSRVNVKLKDRAMLLVRHGPSTIQAARVGEPTLTDPAQTYAPEVTKQTQAVFMAAMKGQPLPGQPASGVSSDSSAAIANGTAPPRTDQPGPKPTFESVPDASGSVGSTVTVEVPSGGEAAPGGAGNSAAPPPATSAASEPVIRPVGPPVEKALPPVDKPSEAPAQINDVKNPGVQNAQVNTGANSSGKKKKVPYNSKEESSSKHKKKKGLDKLNPF
ncbi:outer membrane protein assembly factor BamD [Paracidobacterium acidisoli]|uniref:Outer membrane protein assembly factor BamD n=1 Tax=Paracidobacterium acidisoli TaxID=2303751 RepID=A0A372IL97_9BACT|nr:outer membrane protein assembly factor BamD [Paracidobacterium acidisoli]MBT9332255.1 outer membrane protein assembly factor BamD [Paracidobacterium acidisoli]